MSSTHSVVLFWVMAVGDLVIGKALVNFCLVVDLSDQCQQILKIGGRLKFFRGQSLLFGESLLEPALQLLLELVIGNRLEPFHDVRQGGEGWWVEILFVHEH